MAPSLANESPMSLWRAKKVALSDIGKNAHEKVDKKNR
jgi:hypothetical protein